MRTCRNIEYTSVDTRDSRAIESNFFELDEKPYLWRTILRNSELSALTRSVRGLLTRTVTDHLVGNLLGTLQSSEITQMIDLDCGNGDLIYNLSGILTHKKFLGYDQNRESIAIANARYSHKSKLNFSSQIPDYSPAEPISLMLWRFPSLIPNWHSRLKSIVPLLKNGAKLEVVEWLSVEPFVLPPPTQDQRSEKFVNSVPLTEELRAPEKFRKLTDDSISTDDIVIFEKTESISILSSEQKRAMCTLALLSNELQRRSQSKDHPLNDFLLFNDLNRMILNNYSFGQIKISYMEFSLK